MTARNDVVNLALAWLGAFVRPPESRFKKENVFCACSSLQNDILDCVSMQAASPVEAG